MKSNVVGWFEIPVKDLTRAISFYETVFKLKINVQDFGDVRMGWFPNEDDKPGSSGALIQYKDYVPSKTDGVLIYFNSVEINNNLEIIKDNGGKILQEKTLISPEIGFMALFIDCEGNRVALFQSP
ncbi:VOC family protein [Olleya sp. YS]|uniref:VOC family protein n=1 Tax=Olleya sp. YS TaxID=3028318 RepID=UPI00243451CD|nr:VOC family protein [Olleya sp. YS]WGD34137.1 VOC family protein [Olleya sp. YS]